MFVSSLGEAELCFGQVNLHSMWIKADDVIDNVISSKMDICVATELWLKDNDGPLRASMQAQN